MELINVSSPVKRVPNTIKYMKKNNNSSFETKKEINNPEMEIKKENQENVKKINMKKKYLIKYFYTSNDIKSGYEITEYKITVGLNYLIEKEDYLIRRTENINEAKFYILITKTPFKDATFIFSHIPKEHIIISEENGKTLFKNVALIYFITSSGEDCPNGMETHTPFEEYPTYAIHINTTKKPKYCEKNDSQYMDLIGRIVSISNKNNKNKLVLGSLLKNENVNKNVNKKEEIKTIKINNEVTNLATKSIIISRMNDLYYKLVQKNPQNTLFIQKKMIEKVYENTKNKSSILIPMKKIIDKLNTGLKRNIIFENMLLLQVYIHNFVNINQENIDIRQKAMEEYGSGFREFYEQKESEFKSNDSKNYLMALHYMNHLKHRNAPLYKKSNIIPSYNEFENSYYLGFDVEDMIVKNWKKNGIDSMYIMPFVVKYGEKYIMYYLCVKKKEIYLYEIFYYEKDRNFINKINDKVEYYFQVIFERSFLSKKPMNMKYKGLIRKNENIKLTFLEENQMISLYSHFHLFYNLINPNIDINEIIGKQVKNEFILFISYLLEMI